jgi:hypothetical protein
LPVAHSTRNMPLVIQNSFIRSSRGGPEHRYEADGTRT